MNLTLAQIAHMCGGQLLANANSELMINNVVIDSRQINQHSLFVAISGERQDGHDFVKDGLATFEAGALVNKTYIESVFTNPNSGSSDNLCNLIYVEDTVKAFGLLAKSYRQKFQIPVVGITGSNGKTTVKEMLKLICEYQFGAEHVLATGGNLNNNLGMPLTLLKLNTQHHVAIIEMGMNHGGELDYLSAIAMPDIAVVNNVMLAHAGFFNGLEDIAQAKAEIYHGLHGKSAIACINLLEPMHKAFEKHIAQEVEHFYYGDASSTCYIKNVDSDGQMHVVTACGDLVIKLQILGEHNQKNALTAIALAINLGCSLDSIKQGLNSYTGFKGRLERKTAFNGALIVDDSYNANPESVKAAILAIKELPRPHWFIFADLKELGKFAINSHEEIGLFASDNQIDVLLTIGELAAIAGHKFFGTKLHFASNPDIVKYCKENLPKVATILIKGSNSMNLNDVVSDLLK